MKTYFIHSEEVNLISTQEIQVDAIIDIDIPFVNVANHFNENSKVHFLNIRHHHTITNLNLTSVWPYVLLFFDPELTFKGASYSIMNATGTFTLQTKYKNILFAKMPHHLQVNQIIKLTTI